MEKKYTFDEVVNLIKSNHLPEDFNQWDIADEDGWTVAHIAAICNKLPKEFNQWHLTDRYGITVKMLSIKHILS